MPSWIHLSFSLAIEIARKKKPNLNFEQNKFITLKDGLSVQMMHIGLYDEEDISFNVMKEFISENNLKRKTKEHREVYISDPRKTVPEKMKTVLRYFVER